jgi:hypothetical protein
MEKTTFFWLGINYATTALLFLIITLALVGEWGFRKLFGKKASPVSHKAYQPSHSPMREPDKAQV